MEKGQIEKYMIYKLLCRKYKYEQHKLLVFYKTIFYDVYKYIIKKTEITFILTQKMLRIKTVFDMIKMLNFVVFFIIYL
jgi:hypothetical protein